MRAKFITRFRKEFPTVLASQRAYVARRATCQFGAPELQSVMTADKNSILKFQFAGYNEYEQPFYVFVGEG